MTNHNHPYHLVEKSPWPLTAALAVTLMTSGLVKWFHLFTSELFLMGLIAVLLSSALWWRDIVRESTLQGLHTMKVVTGLRLGMVLFIASEVLFFFSFFWAYFQSSLNSAQDIGGCWPPTGVTPFNPFQIPLLNTAVLLGSGVTITWAHHSACSSSHTQMNKGLTATVSLGVYFTILQSYEYLEASFCLSDSVYGSSFFVATGFHGLHVIIGTTFILVCLMRATASHFSPLRHMGLEASIWYWHFVDVVWLFLFVSIYWWGS